LSYYAGIILNAFANLLCSKLCRHNWRKPTVSSKHIKQWIDTDPILSRVHQYILQGWPTAQQLAEEFKPFKSRKSELTVLDGCILWGARVVVLTQGQKSVLEELHETLAR